MMDQVSYFAELGIRPLWRLRGAEVADTIAEALDAPVAAPREAALPATTPQTQLHARPALAAMRIADALQPHKPVATSAAVSDDAAAAIAAMDWDELEASIRGCARCGLCKQRKQAVPGVGDREADWMVVGEGPGAEEDQRGEPFVGAAGKLLDAMLGSIGLERGKAVYIANAVKCRPPNNRTPEPDEVLACMPYLRRQIELVSPRIILAMGRPAAQSILEREIKIGPARGKRFEYRGIPVVVSYHPAYLLRSLTDKSKAWEDLCFAQDLMRSLPD